MVDLKEYGVCVELPHEKSINIIPDIACLKQTVAPSSWQTLLTPTRAQCGLSEDAGHQDRCEKNIGEEPQSSESSEGPKVGRSLATEWRGKQK